MFKNCYYTSCLNRQPNTIPLYPSPAIGSVLPTGVPSGPATAPMPSIPGIIQSNVDGSMAPQSVQDIYFTPGFLNTQIGQKIRVEFLIGTNGPLIDRSGTLIAVGASYILINPSETDDIEMCDLYSIKFVTIYK